MPEVRKEETNGAVIREMEKRIRYLEAVVTSESATPLPSELANQYTDVTSGAFVPTLHTSLPRVDDEVIEVRVVVTLDSGVSAEVRLYEALSATFTDPVAFGPGPSQHVCQFEWLHGIHLGDTEVEFQVQARRTAGASPVHVYSPRRIISDSALRHPNAAVNGNPSVT